MIASAFSRQKLDPDSPAKPDDRKPGQVLGQLCWLKGIILGFLLTCAGLATGLHAGQLDEWSSRNPLPQGNELAACAYGNGRWVALGTTGTLVTSTDGENWGNGLTPPQFTKDLAGYGTPKIKAMVYGGSQFVAVGMRGQIWTSPDGLSWTSRQSGDGDFVLTSIAFGNGVYVASGHTDRTGGDDPLLWSADGIHWENHSPKDTFYNSVAFGNGIFVVNDIWGGVWRSSNGKNWAKISVSDYKSGKVAFGGGKFIIHQQTTAYLYETFSSPDGQSWVKAKTTGIGLNYQYTFSLCGTDTGFVAAGMWDPESMLRAVYTSADGIDWDGYFLPKGSHLPVASHGGGLYVVVGPGGEIHTSPDGQTWTSRSTESYSLNDVTYGNGLFVAVGESGYGYELWYDGRSSIGPERSILTSPDGVTWTPRGKVATRHYSVAYGNGRFVTASFSSWTSVDGVTWEMSPNAPPSSDEVRFLNGKFVMVGDGIYTSTTGLEWELRQEIEHPLNQNVNSVAYGAGRYVAVGHDNIGGNALIYTSPDGISWTKVATSLEHLTKVRYGNNRFVALDRNGFIHTSATGTTWKTTEGPTELYTESTLDYGNGEFILGGGNGDVWTSNDGVVWERHTTPNCNGLKGITFANDTFVAIGDYGTIIQSAPFTVPIPVMPGKAYLTADQGLPFHFQIEGTNSPESYLALGLPAGLTLDPSTGIISGSPAKTGVFWIKIGATNAGGTRWSSFRLTVIVPPRPPVAAIRKPSAFPDTVVGKKSKVKVLTIWNKGEMPLTNVRVTLAGPNKGDFVMVPPTRKTLKGGQAAGVDVYFKPKGKGIRTATFILSGNAPSARVTLSGTGLPASK